MIDIMINVILVELLVLLAILIVYWLDYTYSYITCHSDSEPCKCDTVVDDDKYENLKKAVEEYYEITDDEGE